MSDDSSKSDGEIDRLGVSNATAVETARKRTADALWQVCSRMYSQPVTRFEHRLPFRCQMWFCSARRRLTNTLNHLAERIWTEADDGE